jgi:dolichol-phosphate mannosyltransferase
MSFHRALIVVPTYNERENVRAVAREFLLPIRDAELLFVDDNSPDGTGEELDAISAEDRRVHVLHRAGKLGLGSAYVEGLSWGLENGYDYLIEMDADFSHQPRYLPDMLELCRTRADVVIGSRYVAGGGTANWGWRRRALSRAGSAYARAVLSVDLRDLTSGFACYRRAALQRMDLGSVRSNGYAFQIEMKYRALRAGLRVLELPIVFEDRRVGQSKMSGRIVAEALWRVWKLRASV